MHVKFQKWSKCQVLNKSQKNQIIRVTSTFRANTLDVNGEVISKHS